MHSTWTIIEPVLEILHAFISTGLQRYPMIVTIYLSFPLMLVRRKSSHSKLLLSHYYSAPFPSPKVLAYPLSRTIRRFPNFRDLCMDNFFIFTLVIQLSKVFPCPQFIKFQASPMLSLF
jgi:hypothetical protein